MEEFKKIINKMSHVGMIRNWDDSHFNEFVVTGRQSGRPDTPMLRIGRVVQVRLSDGMFGDDVVLLRHADGDLTSHENQFYMPIKGKDREIVEEAFKDVCVDDPYNNAYSIAGKNAQKGFIVPDEEMRKSIRDSKIKDLTK